MPNMHNYNTLSINITLHATNSCVQNAGKCLKEIQGYPERVLCLAQVGSTVWCGSAYGSITVHDAQVLLLPLPFLSILLLSFIPSFILFPLHPLHPLHPLIELADTGKRHTLPGSRTRRLGRLRKLTVVCKWACLVWRK